jgi:hypothetical protein
MSRNELKFWFLFLILNSLLFLPAYVFNADTSHFFPFQGLLHGTIYERCKTIFVRSNLDIFRLSVDLFILVFFCYFFRSRLKQQVYGWFTGIYYVIMLLFLTYFNAFEKLYHIPPMIYNDLSMLKLGFFNIGDQSLIKSVVLSFIILAPMAGIIWLVRRLIGMTYDLKLNFPSKLILVIIVLLLIINTLKSGFTYASNQTFQETFALLANNIKSSSDARRNLRNFNVDKINRKLNYKKISLHVKPDIYLLFLESYGKLLYEDEWLRPPFFKCLDSCSARLARKGWSMASDFSISPVSGGESWISYTSVMFGYNIRNQGTYNSMLKDTSMARYDNLFRILKKNGYTTFRLNAMPQNSYLEAPWNTFSRFYSIDNWINFPDLHYKGRLYGFGPSPPDQYSINFATEFIRKNYPAPRALFFITQTTHHPFYCPDSVAADWRSLNQESDNVDFHASLFLKKPRIGDYLKAVCYDLNALTKWISENGDSNAVFILVGDHQPPFFAGKLDGFETPVHIISRNRKFTEAFLQYGFHQGLRPGMKSGPIRHEGIYSMFMRELVRSYSNNYDSLPEYRPYGLITNSL